MNESATVNLEKIEKLPFKIDELKNILKELQEQEEIIWDENIDEDSKIAKIIENRKKLVETFILEAGRFDKVFETSLGSVYFVLSSGESLRAKHFSKNNYSSPYFPEVEHFGFGSIKQNIFFLDSVEVDRLTKSDFLFYHGSNISTVDYAIGMHPFELNIDGFGFRIVFEMEDNILKLIGTESEDREGNKKIDTNESQEVTGGTHIGHPITKIIK